MIIPENHYERRASSVIDEIAQIEVESGKWRSVAANRFSAPDTSEESQTMEVSHD